MGISENEQKGIEALTDTLKMAAMTVFASTFPIKTPGQAKEAAYETECMAKTKEILMRAHASAAMLAEKHTGSYSDKKRQWFIAMQMNVYRELVKILEDTLGEGVGQ